MATKYRIVEEGSAVYIESSYEFLWFTFWHRNRDFYSGTHQGYSHGNGPYTNYGTVARAEQYINSAVGLERRCVWPTRITEYSGKPFDPGSGPYHGYR
jgi:hypothetical protein